MSNTMFSSALYITTLASTDHHTLHSKYQLNSLGYSTNAASYGARRLLTTFVQSQVPIYTPGWRECTFRVDSLPKAASAVM